MWWEFVYEPTTLFSLKASAATNSAGKALFCPSPYSVKMALLNAICTYDMVDTAIQYFDLIKSLKIEFALSEYIVLNNCFLRIVKKDDHPQDKQRDLFIHTVGFREYLYLSGNIKIGINSNLLKDEDNLNFLIHYLARINYFGKRGCFFQFKNVSDYPLQELTKEYSRELTDKNYFSDGRTKLLSKVDDFGPKVTFEKVSNFSKEKTDRILKIICLPFRVLKSNKNFSILKRT